LTIKSEVRGRSSRKQLGVAKAVDDERAPSSAFSRSSCRQAIRFCASLLLFCPSQLDCVFCCSFARPVILAHSHTRTTWPRQFPRPRPPRSPALSSSNRHRHYGIASLAGPRSTRPLSTPLPVSLWLPPVPESTTTHPSLLPRRKISRLPQRRRRLAKRTKRLRRLHRKSRSLPHPRPSLKVRNMTCATPPSNC